MNKYLVKTDSTLMEFLLNHYNKKNVKNLLKFKQVSVNGHALLGVPGMFAYKMVNTLDSMIGYKNERYTRRPNDEGNHQRA